MRCFYSGDVVVVGPGFRAERELGMPARRMVQGASVPELHREDNNRGRKSWDSSGRNSRGRSLRQESEAGNGEL